MSGFWSGRCRRNQSARAALALGVTVLMLGGEDARADCTPQAASNITATCTGITMNQGGDPPGSSTGWVGYGTGGETGITVNVAPSASVIGSIFGMGIGDGTVTNNAGASITGSLFGIWSYGSLTVSNSGSITAPNGSGPPGSGWAITADYDGNVTNNAHSSITGAVDGIVTQFGSATVTNSGSIAGTSDTGISAGTNANVTNNASGSITGGAYGIFANGGGSTIVNAGIISGSIAAIQFSGSGNTLTLERGSSISGNVVGTGNDTFQLGGTWAATFDVSQLGATAQYRGFGTFNKIDGSVWTLTGTNTAALPWAINAGTLLVNGTMGSASMAVNSGGTLGGTGTVGSVTVASGGTFAPGAGTPGSTMNVSSVAFQSGALYLVQVDPTTASLANVSGTATLSGATVNAVFANGSYIEKTYTILSATGGVSGTFAPAVVNTNLPSNFQTDLSYDATHAYLDLSLAFVPPPQSGLNGNQQNVGNALINSFNTNGGIPLVYGGLNAAGLSQASGEPATGSQQTTFNAMSQFMALLTGPFQSGGTSTPNASAPAYAEAEDDALAYAAKDRKLDGEREAYAMFTKAPLRKVYEPRWSVWSSVYGGSQSTDGNTAAGSNDTTSRIFGTAVGADYLFSPRTLAGFALAGGGTNFSVNNLGNGRSDLFQAGAYVRHWNGPAYVSAALAYGWQDVTTDRTVAIAGLDRLHAEFKANAWSGRLEGGYRFVAPFIGGIGITPYGAAQFTTFDLPAYAEQVLAGTGNFALAYGAKSVTDTRSELGLRSDKSFPMTDGVLTLRGRLAWAHDFNPDRSAAATFQALPGASFVVNGAAQAADSALTTASAEMTWLNGWSAAATFEGEFSNVTRSYAGKGVVRYAW